MSDSNITGTLTEVRREDGLRFSAVIRGHTVVMDQPEANGGGDVAASPMELLGAALGGCVALYVHQFCAARGIDDEDLRVDVVAESARSPYRVGRFTIRLTLPAALPVAYREAVERVVKTCPVHNTFSHPPDLVLEMKLADVPVCGDAGSRQEVPATSVRDSPSKGPTRPCTPFIPPGLVLPLDARRWLTARSWKRPVLNSLRSPPAPA